LKKLFKTIYSAVYDDDCHPFHVMGQEVKPAVDPDDLEEIQSLLIIWGGADIHPIYYNHPMHRTTHPGGARDRVEWGLLQAAIEKGIPIAGVCRGAQMLCAAAGGFLLQDVHDHSGHHLVTCSDGAVLNVNSIHHQMMAGLEMVDHELVAWREGRAGAPYGWQNNLIYNPAEDWKEPEFVYFPKINGYAIQWHPEAMALESAATRYILNYITKKEQERADGYSYKALTCDC
jgi:gamma-glutamyl-gamma-aminobutyrate hydrolase PuuD